MLENSPPFPLVVVYGGRRTGMDPEDEKDALFTLQHHDCVQSISFNFGSDTPAQNTHTILFGMGAPFPILDKLRLTVGEFDEDRPNFWSLSLPRTFKAPRLRRLLLTSAGDISIPRLPLLSPIVGLVTLQLTGIPSCLFLPVDYLVPRFALMLQLDYLCIDFCLDTHTQDVEDQLLHAPMTHVILPCLKAIFFIGNPAYMEGLAARISAPFLGNLPSRSSTSLHFPFPGAPAAAVALRPLLLVLSPLPSRLPLLVQPSSLCLLLLVQLLSLRLPPPPG